MKVFIVLLGFVCALALGAPSLDSLESPHPAYVKDIEILPTGNGRIINGQDASRNQFPYQISLRWGLLSASSHICGASIISASVVLTAAHCIQGYGAYAAVAGLLLRTEETANTQTRSASSIVVHENWPGGSVVSPWDVALIRVSSPYTLTTAVQPISIASQGATSTGSAVISGWGRTSSIISTLPSTLQYVNKEILPNNECASDLASVLGSSNPLDDTMICTSGRQNLAVCSGDSGGPLVQNGVQIGIVSWGVSPCARTIAPSVFTRVSSYSDWINSRI